MRGRPNTMNRKLIAEDLALRFRAGR